MPVQVLQQLVRDCIAPHIDMKPLRLTQREEKLDKQQLEALVAKAVR